jgi:hypothetical protein
VALDAPNSETPLTDIVTVRGWAVSAAAPIRMVEAWLGETSLGTVDDREARPDAFDLVVSPYPLCGFVQTFPIPPGARDANQLKIRVTDAAGHVTNVERPVTISIATAHLRGGRSTTRTRTILGPAHPPNSLDAPLETGDVLLPEQLRAVEAEIMFDAADVLGEDDPGQADARLDGDDSGKVNG